MTSTPKEYPMSPLLKARPDFLGVALGGDNLNIFKELLMISELFTTRRLHLDPSNSSNNQGDNSSGTELDETLTCNGIDCDYRTPQNIQEPTPGTSKGDSNPSSDDSEHILDRTSNGTNMTPYTCNDDTLKLFKILKKLKIPFKTELYKIKEERSFVDSNVYYCKNLFLKDRRGQYFLVICHENLNMDLKLLRKSLNAYRNFNFGTAQEMTSMLGTLPGGVTPFGLMNQNASGVRMVVHKSLVKEDAWLMFHPFDQSLATKITLPSLMRYLKSCGHDVTFIK